MNSFNLTDLDEMLLRVRSKASKLYISEAINAYRVGAYRAGIISTWIAVVYDIIEKLKELSDQKDNNANRYRTELQNAIESNNIPKLQILENNLLKIAFEEFNFISNHEYNLLIRLKEDRNLCAHPAFIEGNILFNPTSELLRSHIVHAIKYLLIHKPVQGKAAIDMIGNDLKSVSFPEGLEKTYEYLNEKYLKRSKDILVKNLLKIIAKNLVRKTDDDLIGKEHRLLNCLIVISRTHPLIYKEEIKDFLNKIIDNISDSELLNVLWLLEVDQSGWNWLENPAKIRLKNLLEKKLEPTPEALKRYWLVEKLEIEDLKEVKVQILKEISNIIYTNIYEYLNASSFRNAELIGEEKILPFAKYFKPEHVEKVIYAFENSKSEQILYASGSPDIWAELFDKTSHLIDETIDFWVNFREIIYSKNKRKNYYRVLEKIEKEEFLLKS